MRGLPNAPQPQQSRSIRQSSAFDKFYRMQPPVFLGGSDPFVAEEWILEMEKRFDYFECTEEDKVHCAIFMLRKDAWLWWIFTRRSMNVQENPIGWEQFKNLFLDRYFPQAVRDDKKDEFIRLQQGDLTLDEYIRKFEQLSRFAPYLVDTDEMKASRFEQGLSPELLISFPVSKLTTYSELVHYARIAVYLKEKFTDRQSNYQSYQQFEGTGKRGFENDDNNSWNSYADKKKPRVYGRYVCYFCGNEGHRVKECPEKSFENDDNNSWNSYADKKKPRVYGRYACYFCGNEGHRVKECPEKNGRS